jgi:predicted RNA-binding protein with PIN domain
MSVIIASVEILVTRAAMTFLIDGYNLMHAVGLLPRGTIPQGKLERARTRFLDWLATSSKGRAARLRVVFDAQNASSSSPETEHKSIQVLFSFRQTADDVIEDLLAAAGLPSRVTVVSNDTRLQAAGHRRGAAVKTCQQFVDWLIEEPSGAASPLPEAEKPEPNVSADEMDAWLSAFTEPKPRRKGK